MPQSATELSAAIGLRSDELKNDINKLLDHQDDIQDDVLTLQRRKRNGEVIDEDLLKKLKKAQTDSSSMIGLLARERTELLDDLPVIRLASGKIKVIAAELEQDSALIEQTAEKLKQSTKTLQKAEKLLVKIIGLVGML